VVYLYRLLYFTCIGLAAGAGRTIATALLRLGRLQRFRRMLHSTDGELIITTLLPYSLIKRSFALLYADNVGRQLGRHDDT
jgi:hypothetical protein